MRRTTGFVGRACLALGVGLALAAGCAPPGPRVPSLERGPRPVRVGLVVRAPRVEARTRGLWRVRAATVAGSIAPGTLLVGEVRDGRIVLSGDGQLVAADAQRIDLEPIEPAARLVLGEATYAGRFELREAERLVTLVEEIDLEAYLRGVVPFEIGRLPVEALAAAEAQAIAARTYTLSRLGSYAAEGFDVYPDERDQIYKGELREDRLATRALAATRGQILEYHGQLAQTYYSSTCGGFTSRIENVWPKPAAPYLRGRRDAAGDGASFCRDSRHFRWTEVWSGAELERILQTTLPRTLRLPAGTRVGALLDLRAQNRDLSGRILDLEVETTSGTYRVHGDAIRWVLCPADRPLLRSLMFDLDLERQAGRIVRVVVRGGGNGHGVGMCQTGAIGMARAGYDAAAILQHYYPGTDLRAID